MYHGGLSRRGATRVQRLAWTVADLAGAEGPSVEHARTALALRQGDPLRTAAISSAFAMCLALLAERRAVTASATPDLRPTRHIVLG